jgi:hypothetical protein
MAETPHAPVPAAPAVAPEAPPRAASVPGRLGIGVNVFLQVLLSLVILAAVNYLGFQYYWRWDLSPSQDHTLSSSTTNFLRKNSKEIKITALFVRGSPVNDNLRSLLEEYRRNGKKLVKVDFLDPSRDIAQAEKLKMEAGVELSQNGLLVQANKRTRFIPEEEIVMKLKQTGSTQPSLIFRGEDAVTSAIIGLIEGGVRTFHFLSGKGARGDAATKDALDGLHELGRQQNFQVDLINLAEVSAIPERSSGLIIVGPRYDITEREMQIIGDFWQRKKSGLLILLDPDAETPRLPFLRGGHTAEGSRARGREHQHRPGEGVGGAGRVLKGHRHHQGALGEHVRLLRADSVPLAAPRRSEAPGAEHHRRAARAGGEAILGRDQLPRPDSCRR